MGETLAARGFDVIERRTEGDASRAGIIDALDELVAAVAADVGDDAVVLYYSGHGGRVVRPDFEARKAAGLSVHFQFIVPHDMAKSDTGDFRGVLSEELTHYQRRLTDAFRARGAVPNVTTILDCCHSGYMARALGALPKSVDLEAKMFRMKGVREHAQQLGAQLDHGGLVTNLDAVRLVACQPEQSAFEFPSKRGGRHGALTDALASVLEELGPAPMSWTVVGDLVRRRVRALVPEQRPEVEGPTDRVLFSPETLPARTALPVTTVDGVATIEAAPLLGISVGDEFELVVAGHTDPAGTAVVSGIEGGSAVLDVSPASARAALEGSAVAVPTRISVPKVLFHIDYAGPGADALVAAIGESSKIGAGAEGALASIARDAQGLSLLDAAGARWRTAAFADDEHGHGELVEVLESLAIGRRLLDLPSGEGASALPSVVEVEFGTVEADGRRPLALHGARLPAGSKAFLTIRNTGDEELYVWVFDVGVSGRSSLLTNAAPSGTLLGPKGGEDDTLDVWGPAGEALFWPGDVPVSPAAAGGDAARPETFVVVVADRRSDLSSLAGRSGTARGSARSPLDAILDEARTGVREVAPTSAGEPPLRYRLEEVEFLLLPK